MFPIGAGVDDRQCRAHVSTLEVHAILAYGRRSGTPRGTSDCGDFVDSFAADIRGATRTITDRDSWKSRRIRIRVWPWSDRRRRGRRDLQSAFKFPSRARYDSRQRNVAGPRDHLTCTAAGLSAKNKKIARL